MVTPRFVLDDPTSLTIEVEGVGRRWLALESEMIRLFKEVNRRGKIAQADLVARLEQRLEQEWGVKKAFALSSGTAALRLAYEYVKLKHSAKQQQPQEIITTPLSYITTAYPASEAGYVVRFVDIDPQTMTLDPEAVRRALSPNTAAIVPVHLYGQAANMSALLQLAEDASIPLVEDLAQAQGAKYIGRDGREKVVGSESLFGCTSFYAGKLIGGIDDAGAIFTSDEEMIPYLLGGRDQGRSTGERYFHPMYGWKFRLGEFNAAVITLEISYVQKWIQRRQHIAQQYNEAFAEIPELTTPFVSPANNHVYYKYTVLASSPAERERIELHLHAKGVNTERIYPTLIPDQPMYRSKQLPCIVDDLPVARDVVQRLFCLPMHEMLENSEIKRVIEAVQSAYMHEKSGV